MRHADSAQPSLKGALLLASVLGGTGLVAELFAQPAKPSAAATTEKPNGTDRKPSVSAEKPGEARGGTNTSGKAGDRREPSLPSLDLMLSTALEHHPDIRAAKARLQAADADLDRTRLEVMTQITKFRREWESRIAEVQVAEFELFRAKELAGSGAAGERLAVEARRRLELLQATLVELEAQLPLLLGRRREELKAVEDADQTATSRERQTELLAIARQGLEAARQEWRSGSGFDAERMHLWARRVRDAELALAENEADRTAAHDAYRSQVKSLLKVAEAALRAGELGLADVLAARYYLREAEANRGEKP